MKATSLTNVSKKHFKKTIQEVKGLPITDRATFGYSSHTILVYGHKNNERRCGISMRNHSGKISLLITDFQGRFLFNGGFDISTPTLTLLNHYWAIYQSVRKQMKPRMLTKTNF
ncbi:hypothetical protein KO02_12110 [Sphingobacterium sp. ML3W]|uniref:hypothetical protein n=1 Tax=Sphingobacterium sp. ML3W TaxID=1538644 RepID=UPI0004F64569|nr:hypothetical protein [Sphingobacterium sp. ML3W]AIM37354.1 hypothetical protein KO02_12110 [Sphingobacterium sp. ML3W]